MRPQNYALFFVVTRPAFFRCTYNHSKFVKPSLAVSNCTRELDTNGTRPPIVVLPGIMSTRMIAWKYKNCKGSDININDVVWLNIQKIVETLTIDSRCWLDCVKLAQNGSDPSTCKIRADEGLGAIGELSPGNIYRPSATTVFTVLIKYLSHNFGYDVNNLISMPYDWRMAPMQLEDRDSYFSTLKFKLETAVRRYKRPSVVIAHSMGNNLFSYFIDWLRANLKNEAQNWITRHIWTYVGISAPLLGAPGALRSVVSGNTLGIPVSEAQARDIEVTFPSTHLCTPRSSRKGHSTSNANTNRTRTFKQRNIHKFSFDYIGDIITIKKSSTLPETLKAGKFTGTNNTIDTKLGDIFNDTLMK
eukprot:gene10291-21479_t